MLGELANPDERLFVIADLSKVWLAANISETDLGRVRVGSPARARVASYPDQVFAGKVNYIGAVLDKETRDDRGPSSSWITPRACSVRRCSQTSPSSPGSVRKVLALPESAVTLVQGLPTVFVEEHGGFEARPVELDGTIGRQGDPEIGRQARRAVATEGVYALKARLLKVANRRRPCALSVTC